MIEGDVLKKEENQLEEIKPTSWREYWADLVTTWLGLHCEHGADAKGHKTLACDLHSGFAAWCAGQGLPALSTRTFGDLLRERGVRIAGKDGHGRVMRWPIRLKPVVSSAAEQEVRRADPTALWTGVGG